MAPRDPRPLALRRARPTRRSPSPGSTEPVAGPCRHHRRRLHRPVGGAASRRGRRRRRRWSRPKRVGWGASGRNGGQLHSGQRRDQDWLEAHLGRDDAQRLWRLAEEAKALTKGLIARHAHRLRLARRPDRDGAQAAPRRRRDAPMSRSSGATTATSRSSGSTATQLAAAIGTRRLFRRAARHAAPATSTRSSSRKGWRGPRPGRARASSRNSRATKVAGRGDGRRSRSALRRLRATPSRADIVILAGNGYLDGIDADVEARVMPIDNYILATEPIGAGTPRRPDPRRRGGLRHALRRLLLPPDARTAGCSSAAARPIRGGRRATSPAFVRRHLATRLPAARRRRAIDYAWGGTLAITLQRLPFIRRVRPGVYAAAGYSGQGVALAPFAGKVLADAIRGDTGPPRPLRGASRVRAFPAASFSASRRSSPA